MPTRTTTRNRMSRDSNRALRINLETQRTDPITSRTGLYNACWDVFGASRNKEGLTHMHKDDKGYPTIGAGHLVYKTGQNKAEARRKYINDMVAIGISAAQAGRDFDDATSPSARTIRRNGADVVVQPREIRITEEQAKKLFYIDVAAKYDAVIKKFPKLHSYPAEVQVALVRTAYHGLLPKVKQSDDVKVIVRSMAEAWSNEASARHRPVNVTRGTQIAAACQAVDVNMPRLIADAWNSSRGQRHYRNYIKPMIENAREHRYDNVSSNNSINTHQRGRGGR